MCTYKRCITIISTVFAPPSRGTSRAILGGNSIPFRMCIGLAFRSGSTSDTPQTCRHSSKTACHLPIHLHWSYTLLWPTPLGESVVRFGIGVDTKDNEPVAKISISFALHFESALEPEMLNLFVKIIKSFVITQAMIVYYSLYADRKFATLVQGK